MLRVLCRAGCGEPPCHIDFLTVAASMSPAFMFYVPCSFMQDHNKWSRELVEGDMRCLRVGGCGGATAPLRHRLSDRCRKHESCVLCSVFCVRGVRCTTARSGAVNCRKRTMALWDVSCLRVGGCGGGGSPPAKSTF